MENRNKILIVWRTLGALVLGLLLAKWSWALFAPTASAVAVTPPRDALAAAGLFGEMPVGAQADSGAVMPGARLVGVFAPKQDKKGFAVLSLDGRNQIGLALGESTPSGARLAEVHPDYVVLERAGARQRVELENAQIKPAESAPPMVRPVEAAAMGQTLK